jgi:hypothetical protein
MIGVNTADLPFPYDQGCFLRKVNLRRARNVYHAALQQAERIAKIEHDQGLIKSTRTEWGESLNLYVLAVQPVRPAAKIISLNQLRSQVESLESGFATGRDSQIPGGILYRSMVISGNRRSAQVLFDNGMVCDFGVAHVPLQNERPRLRLLRVVRRLIATIHAAQSLYGSASYSEDVALTISLENLGEYAVEPLISSDWDLHDYDLALLPGWRWDYLIPAMTMGNLSSLDVFCAGIIKELCWGFGEPAVNYQALESIAPKVGLNLPKEIPPGGEP